MPRAFVAARRDSCAAYRHYPGNVPLDLDTAYAIQDRTLSPVLTTASAVGKSAASVRRMYAQLGADRLAGPILPRSSTRITMVANAIRSQIFGRLWRGGGRIPDPHQSGLDPGKRNIRWRKPQARIDRRCMYGIEIASSPFPGINELGPPVTVSDFGNNNGISSGRAIADWRRHGDDRRLGRISFVSTVKKSGTGRASFIPRRIHRFGSLSARKSGDARDRRRFRAWISSGAVTGVILSMPGQHVEARFGAEYSVSCTIEAAYALAPRNANMDAPNRHLTT